MNEIEELDLVLRLLRKYKLPISPILEFSINEKKEAFLPSIDEEQRPAESPPVATNENNAEAGSDATNIILTREIIESARTPNGGYTKSQLAAIGVEWPPAEDWIEKKIGSSVTSSQLEEFRLIRYISGTKKASRKRGYLSVAGNQDDAARMKSILDAIGHFKVPATPFDIARAVSRSVWGEVVKAETVDSYLKLMPEIEYVPWGKYKLRDL
ncbi:MAG: hypothetical protein IJ142_08965 [Bacteroidaceae bacterium]|nr:hypothetical protein [Bacteroidaceae bacterium]